MDAIIALPVICRLVGFMVCFLVPIANPPGPKSCVNIPFLNCNIRQAVSPRRNFCAAIKDVIFNCGAYQRMSLVTLLPDVQLSAGARA